VWIDDLNIRRIAVCSAERTETLELWDFAVGLDDLDWTRPPTFRSPEEAAGLADQRLKGGLSSAAVQAVGRYDPAGRDSVAAAMTAMRPSASER
jgi:hypothetical protein